MNYRSLSRTTTKAISIWKRSDILVKKHPFRFNVVLSLISGMFVFIVHPLSAVITMPYWLDEAWVALSTRFPLTDLSNLTASTPIGFSFLLRLIPDPNALRLIPLLFLALTVATGYWLGHALGNNKGKSSVGMGLLVVIFLLLAPFLLSQNALKQYTADAFMAVLILLLCAQLDNHFSNKKFLILALIVPVGMLFSHTTIFVGVSALTAVCIGSMLKKDWRNLRNYLALSSLSLGLSYLYYLLVDKHGQTASLKSFWSAYYPRINKLPSFILEHLRSVAPTHSSAMAIILLLLAGFGIVRMFISHQRITSLTIFLTFLAAITAGLAKLYPLLDVRTSTYLLTLGTIAIVLGLVGLGDVLGNYFFAYKNIPLIIGLVGLIAYGQPLIGEVNIPNEDIRHATNYVLDSYKSGDKIVVNAGAAYGFAFYWPSAPLIQRNADWAVGFVPYYSDKSITIMTQESGSKLKDTATQEMKKLNRGNSEWVIASHISPSEASAIRAWTGAGYLVSDKGNAVVIRLSK